MPQCTNTTNCRPKFRFPPTRISFVVHTLYRNVIVPNNNILRSHPKKILKVGSNCQPVLLKKQQESGKAGLMIYKKNWN